MTAAAGLNRPTTERGETMIGGKDQKAKAVNMYEHTGRYFQTLAPRRQREAEKLDEHFREAERVFLWSKDREG